MPSRLLPLAFLFAALSACGGSGSDSRAKPDDPPSLPGHIVVDHILIGVKSAENLNGKRSEGDARAYAYALLDKIKGGADWAAAKRENSEDSPPGGPYGLADRNVRPAPGEMPRTRMVPAFGDVGFSLSVGQIAMANYDRVKSPFGFHIIKRVK